MNTTSSSHIQDSNGTAKKPRIAPPASNCPASSTPSGTANCGHGFITTNIDLRSILAHPISFILSYLLNHYNAEETNLNLPAGFDTDAIKNELLRLEACEVKSQYNTIFASAAKAWNGFNETDLTTKIFTGMEKHMKDKELDEFIVVKPTDKELNVDELREDQLVITAEKCVANGKGKPDFIIYQKNRFHQGNNEKSVVMIIEFGIGHQFWWKKQDQILQYVDLLLQTPTKNGSYIVDEPILLTVITVNKLTVNDNSASASNEVQGESTGHANNTELQVESDCSDRDMTSGGTHINANVNIENINQSTTGSYGDSDTGHSLDQEHGPVHEEDIVEPKIEVRIGMLLCTRKEGKASRVSLLWRKETSNLADASTHFGKVLSTAQMCEYLRKQNDAMESYEYLGPNCCRFDAEVRTCTRMPPDSLCVELVSEWIIWLISQNHSVQNSNFE